MSQDLITLVVRKTVYSSVVVKKEEFQKIQESKDPGDDAICHLVDEVEGDWEIDGGSPKVVAIEGDVSNWVDDAVFSIPFSAWRDPISSNRIKILKQS